MQGRVHKYEGQRGVSWFYVHDLPANASDRGRRQVKRRGFATKRAAQEALTAALREVDTGSFVERSKLTVGQFLQDEWLPAIEASGIQKSGTIDQYRIYIRVRVMPSIGGIALQQLDAAALDRFYVDLGQRLAAKSVRNTALMMSTALKFAVKRGRVSRSPAPDAHMPKAPRTTMQYWAPEETKAFLDSVRDDRLYALWLLFATTGMRRGEAMALRWDDVDFDRSRVSIQRSLVVNSGVVKIETPKTDRSVRSIAISPASKNALRQWRRAQLEERLAWGEAYTESGFVFTNEDGAVIDPRTISKRFQRLIAVAGVRAIRLHDVRHSYATAALRAGIPAKVVSERLGHKSIAMTLDTYSHVLPQADEEAAETVERLILGE